MKSNHVLMDVSRANFNANRSTRVGQAQGQANQADDADQEKQNASTGWNGRRGQMQALFCALVRWGRLGTPKIPAQYVQGSEHCNIDRNYQYLLVPVGTYRYLSVPISTYCYLSVAIGSFRKRSDSLFISVSIGMYRLLSET